MAVLVVRLSRISSTGLGAMDIGEELLWTKRFWGELRQGSNAIPAVKLDSRLRGNDGVRIQRPIAPRRQAFQGSFPALQSNTASRRRPHSDTFVLFLNNALYRDSQVPAWRPSITTGVKRLQKASRRGLFDGLHALDFGLVGASGGGLGGVAHGIADDGTGVVRVAGLARERANGSSISPR